MRKYCGAFLESTPPSNINLVNVNDGYGTDNLYCRWVTNSINIKKSINFNFTNNFPMIGNKYSMVITYANGNQISYDLTSSSYWFSAVSISEIDLHFFTKNGNMPIPPFYVNIDYPKPVTDTYVSIFVSLGIVIASCLLCTFLLYKCSRILKARQSNFNHRIEELSRENSPVRRNIEREDELKYKNAEKLNALFENELKPIRYSEEINEFEGNCTICLEEFKFKSWVIKLFCRHIFHIKCIENWCTKTILHPKCPNCNFSMIPYKDDELGVSILRIYHDNRNNNVNNTGENSILNNNISQRTNLNNLNNANIVESSNANNNHNLSLLNRGSINNPEVRSSEMMNLSNIDIREANAENRQTNTNEEEINNNFI